MLTKREALERAKDFLAAESSSWGTPVAVQEEKVFLREGRLIAPFNSIAYIGGQKRKELAGNMPIEVNLASGKCHFIDLDEVFEYMDLGLL
ncbi:hypothetical protein ACNPQM_36380 [Streptomyces sp. NPDC056231]|uniref:hypothetical protein n=1 Tax=Streptomyces sp. NPDC056231 TaxID=3345755 RepID=UPI003AAA97C5